MPKAIRVLEEQSHSGRTDAWRPAVRVLEHAWGRPPEHVVEPDLPVITELSDIEKMPTSQLLKLVAEDRAREAAPEPDVDPRCR